MRIAASLWFLALLTAQTANDNAVEALRGIATRGLPAEEAANLARRPLLEGLDREIGAGIRAIGENRPDEVEIRLARAATLARPYDEAYSKLLLGLVLSARRRTRAEGAALVRAVAEDIRQGKSYAERIALARKTSALKLYGNLLASLEARAKEWLKNAPTPEAVDAEAARWNAIPPAAGYGCTVCKNSGEVPCTCKQGSVDEKCRPCEGKGTIPCILCEGKGTLEHHGFVGTMRLTISRAVSVPVKLDNGRTVQAKMLPQALTWRLDACNGSGRFRLRTESKPFDPKARAADPQEIDQTCGKLWGELKAFVFNGRAKIEIQVEDGRMEPMTAQAAKRFLADYERCADGRLPCERCEGKATNPCTSCASRGTVPAPCGNCSGVATVLCSTCAFVGDTAWLGTLLPPSRLPGLAASLTRHGGALREWVQRRSKTESRLIDLNAQLKEAKKRIDLTAVVTPAGVTVTCPACKGRGGSCEECWGTGKREYEEGTPQYEKYAYAARLERQIAEASKDLRQAAPLPQIDISEPATEKPVERPEPPPVADPAPAAPTSLPKEIRDVIAAADQACEEGIRHLEASKKSNDDQTWISEARKALAKLREARAGYASAQEACEARGIEIPRELMDKIVRNMQALVIARKQSP